MMLCLMPTTCSVNLTAIILRNPRLISYVPVAFYKKNGFDFMFSTEEQEKSYRGIVSDKPLKTRLMYFDLILIK